MAQGWQLRPATTDDFPAIVEIVQAEDLRYRGHTDFSLEWMLEYLATDPGFDTERDQVVVESDGGLIAAVVVTSQVAIIDLHPDREDPKLRTDLLAWAEHRQSELAREGFRVQVAAANSPAVAFLIAAGYALERCYARMVIDLDPTGPPEPARLAADYRLRPIDRAHDVGALHALHHRAFGDRPDHRPEDLETWERRHIRSSEFAPEWSRAVETADGRLAGSLIGSRSPDQPHGHVALLGVDPEHRRQGVARALLLSAFAAIGRADLRSADLWVASDNPRALELYHSVGMHERERFDNYVRTG